MTQQVTIAESWSTVTDDHENFASGRTREEAIARHLQGNRDMKQAIADLSALGPLATKWKSYKFPTIQGVRRTITVTCVEVSETVETEDLPNDPFGWERDGEVCCGTT
ncbi:hypothetical protein [Rhodococcoides fascians]|uniref:hypothetical protein n=1 Tax=Rhodococcoides fascians TaxID=1828 RepID=UPI00050C0BFB|nr:hypothetical protein [Rhodococcus fascians]